MLFNEEIEAVDKTKMTAEVIAILNKNDCEAWGMGHMSHGATSISARTRDETDPRDFSILLKFDGDVMRAALLKEGEAVHMEHGDTEWRTRSSEITPDLDSRLHEVRPGQPDSRRDFLAAVETFCKGMSHDFEPDEETETFRFA